MKEICPIEQCTGCTACLNACAKSAITMQPDNLGFMYPSIDESLCVDCGLCERSCPNNHPVTKYLPPESFVGHAENTDEQLSSTSGGIASAISRWCIRKGGVVYGCSAKECTHVKHIRVTHEEELKWLKGSKYVQSDMGMCYSLVKDDLKDNRTVVFIGTPCQCAGLKSFLRKDYDNLYLIDFVCHGVPSQSVLNEELKLHASESQLESARLNFRRKLQKETEYSTQYGIFLNDESNNEIFAEVFPSNTYITGFLTGLFYRNSCYQCHYTTPERVSDITLGDYGDHSGDYKSMEGRKRLLSMITVNTEKGHQVLNSIGDTIICKSIEYDKLVNAQGQLRRPIARHNLRSEFELILPQTGYRVASKSLLKEDIARIKRNLLISQIRDTLFKIPFVKSIYKQLRNR